MAYTPNTWVKGDTITSAKMNHMEAGISHAEEYVDRIQGAIDELEAGSLSAVGASAGTMPVADGNGSWEWAADPVAEEVLDLKSAIPGVFNTESFDGGVDGNKYQIEKGYYDISTGELKNGAAYAYSAVLSKFGGRTVYVSVGEDYNFAVRMWDGNGDFDSSKNTGYIKSALVYVPDDYTIAFNFRNNDTTSMNSNDYDAISDSLHLYTDGNQYEDTTLSTGVDFNTLTKTGNYRFPSNQSGTKTNQPTDEWGRLVVVNSESDASCVQIYFSYKGKIFTRFKTSVAGNTWTDWTRYDDTVFKNRTPVYNQEDKIDFNLMTAQGRYGLSNIQASAAENSPTPYEGHLLVFAGDICLQVYVNQYNEVYYRTFRHNAWTAWQRPLTPDTSLTMPGAAADARATGGIYFRNGECLRMSSAPEAIPVGESHLGYNEFIAATWDTLLPDNYQAGDEYNANTTKLLNVHVERESNWTSTPYGENVDTYPIYRYVLTPQYGYKRTVLLTSGCHGNEAEGYWGLYRLIRMIFEDGYKYPTLRNLRDVRFIIIPSWNPWGMQHYRRYNAFSALNTGSTDVAKNLQAWNWLWAENNQITVNGVAYDISDVGEASVIKDTLDDYAGEISLWLDFHTDPYAGRTTSAGEIDDPRGSTDPYGFYGFARNNSVTAQRLKLVMEDFYGILKNECSFTEKWYLRTPGTNPSTSGFSGYMAGQPFPAALLEVSTFMTNFPYASGSAQMMKLTQEYYANCLSNMMGA